MDNPARTNNGNTTDGNTRTSRNAHPAEPAAFANAVTLYLTLVEADAELTREIFPQLARGGVLSRTALVDRGIGRIAILSLLRDFPRLAQLGRPEWVAEMEVTNTKQADL